MSKPRKKPAVPPAFAADASPPPRAFEVSPIDDEALAVAANARPPNDAELTAIVELIGKGETAPAIRKMIADNFPHLVPEAALQAGMVRLADHLGLNADLVTAWVFEATRTLYREAMKAGAFADALRALRYCNDLAASLAVMKAPDVSNENDSSNAE